MEAKLGDKTVTESPEKTQMDNHFFWFLEEGNEWHLSGC